ncbi:MAG: alpha/beta hydrolase [bacterium]|nr:alpha/beta hydrolase [bacterium]
MEQSILDHKIISERYFFPRKVTFDNPLMVECDGARLGCYYHKKLPDAKTIILFHGNGEVAPEYIESYTPLFEEMGCNTLLAEYRGYGMSSGTPGLVSMLDDVEHIIKATGLQEKDIILFGRSIGSFYVLEGVKRFPNIAGLIIESGVADVLERVLMRVNPQELGITLPELQQEVAKHFNQQGKLANYKGATLVMHAQHDSMVDFTHGRRLYDWAPEPKEAAFFEKGDHNDIMVVNTKEYFQLIYGFINQLSK